MFPPRWFLPADIVIQLITAIIALVVAAYAYRGYRWFGERSLHRLYISFSLLAAAFFINGLTLGYAFFARLTFARAVAPFVLADLGFWVYFILQVFAYGILVYSYTRRMRDAAVVSALVGGSLLFAAQIFEVIIVVMLFMIVASLIAHYMVNRSQNSFIVLTSFSMIFLGQMLLLFGPFIEMSYVVGKIIQLFGFLSLLLLLFRLRGPV